MHGMRCFTHRPVVIVLTSQFILLHCRHRLPFTVYRAPAQAAGLSLAALVIALIRAKESRWITFSWQPGTASPWLILSILTSNMCLIRPILVASIFATLLSKTKLTMDGTLRDG